MKITGYYVLIGVLVLLLAIAAGCTTTTTPQPAPAATQAPANPAAAAQQTYQQTAAAPGSASTADIDTTINVKSHGLACINVQDLIGTTYLYPDQKIRLEAASPGTINVNVLFVDENDQLALRETEARRDTIKNIWVYDGVVPLAQFNDITTPVEKTFTIKRQSKYYICADDRQESQINENTYRVPVKMTRL